MYASRRIPTVSIALAFAAKYVGFFIGPNAGHLRWEAPPLKFTKACMRWRAFLLGVLYDISAYRTYCLSIISFISQLAALPGCALDAEVRALRLFADRGVCTPPMISSSGTCRFS